MKDTKIITLEDLGYNDFFNDQRIALDLENFSIARVIAEYKETYKVKSINGEYLAKITGKQVFNALKREDFPAVGDWVAITELDKSTALIHKILPRKTILKKKYSAKNDIQIIAANVDVAFIVEAIDRDYNLNRLERYLVLTNEAKIIPIVLLNKIDLISKEALYCKINQIKNRFSNIEVITASSITEQGLDDLTQKITAKKTYCFLGSSGVGKSSLINKLLGTNSIVTQNISQSTGKGKHTTTGRDMYFLKDGGIVIDNPGMREVGIADLTDSVDDTFTEIASFSQNCRFTDCTHTHENGCAVLNAVNKKIIDEAKYSNYQKLKKEAEYYEMSDLEKRRKDRKFSKFVKKALEQLKK